MSEPMDLTQEHLRAMRTVIDAIRADIATLNERMNTRFDAMDRRFAAVESKIEEIHDDLLAYDARFVAI